MRNIIIVGANSAIAKAVIPTLANDNRVITVGRGDCDIYCDINNVIKLPDNADVLINFAAALGGESDQDILDNIETNIKGVLKLCMAAKKSGIRHFIQISTIYTKLNEDSANYSTYSITKKHADELLSFYSRKNNLNLTILKPSQVYGDSTDFAKNQPFLYQIIDHASKGEDIIIYGKHDPARNFIHVSDIGEIIRRVVDMGLIGTYELTNPNNVYFSELAQIAQRIYVKGGSILFQKDKPDIEDNIFAYNSMIYDKTGYSPRIDMEEGIQRIKNNLEDSSE